MIVGLKPLRNCLNIIVYKIQTHSYKSPASASTKKVVGIVVTNATNPFFFLLYVISLEDKETDISPEPTRLEYRHAQRKSSRKGS